MAGFFIMINAPLIIEDEDLVQEECGLVAVYTPRASKQMEVALTAAGGVQHRGQQGAGVASKTSSGIEKFTAVGLLKDIFTAKRVAALNKLSKWTIVHCRYGTSGDYNSCNLQPCIEKFPGNISVALVHNGQFVGTEAIRKQLNKKLPKGTSDTYLVSQLLRTLEGKTMEEKIVKLLGLVNGAYSVIIGSGNNLYIARDNFGMRPLVIGKLKNGWLVASETFALDKAGAKLIRTVKKGEVIRINDEGIHVLKRGTDGKGNFCDFEWAYFSRPNTMHPVSEGSDELLSVSEFRERCGKILADEAPIKNATFVVGAPDSGLAVSLGYANALRIPYKQVMIRDHFDNNGSQRLFMRDDDKKKIKNKVLGKLSFVPDPSIWKDAIVVIGDDSIVRGNVSSKVTQAIFRLGAKEVHWIVGFPPVKFSCHLGVSIRQDGELIAAKYADEARIAKALGATSVHYISNVGFLKARLKNGKLARSADPNDIFLMNGGCGGCITGKYPINADGSRAAPYQAV